MKVNCALLLAAFSLLCGSSASEELEHHDGSTVTKMLARLGLGPGVNSGALCEGDAACLQEEEEGGSIPTDMCWGYEKGCSREKRLFVPKCEGAAKPW